MKKIFPFLSVLLCVWSTTALATPALQLDIAGGYYNLSGDPRYDDETVIAPEDQFTLYALMKPKNNKTALSDTYNLSMALFLRDGQSPPDSSVGSFSFTHDGGTLNTINVPGNMTLGNPGIPSHSVFPTYYSLKPFQFSESNTVGKYNTQDNPGQFDTFSGGTGMYYAAFVFDTTNLSDNYSIHFDLFNDNTKAPFSHDANDAQSDPPPIPEPTTMLLLDTRLAGLAGFRKKFIRR